MSEPLQALSPSLPRRPRGQPLLAWIVIIAVCGFVIYRNFVAGSSLSTVAVKSASAIGRQTNVYLLLVGGALFLVGALGLVLLMGWAILVGLGKLRLRLRPVPQYGGIYAETFALWMLLYLGLGLAFGLLHIRGARLLMAAVAMLLSLSALAWPVIRGVSWQRVRHDLGLHLGQEPGLEMLFGLGTYAAALPLAFIGALLTLLLIAIHKQLAPGVPENIPNHPIVKEIATGSWWRWWQVFFAASVVAPLVEETMFRGVLYRHLREAGFRWGKMVSVISATVVTSFIFASIHPQGWLGIPPLMMLATAFTLAREWRGSLLPSMVAHSVNNAVVTAISIVTFG